MQGGRVVAATPATRPVDGTAPGVSFAWQAPVGSNQEGCGAWSQPCASIQGAINSTIAAGGSAVYVGPGAVAIQNICCQCEHTVTEIENVSYLITLLPICCHSAAETFSHVALKGQATHAGWASVHGKTSKGHTEPSAASYSADETSKIDMQEA